MADYPLTAAAIKQEFKRAGIHFVVALPDRVTSHYLLKGLLADPDYKVVQVCKEDEGVSICSGLYAAGHKSVLMMQYTGFLDSINSIRGIAVEYLLHEDRRNDLEVLDGQDPDERVHEERGAHDRDRPRVPKTLPDLAPGPLHRSDEPEIVDAQEA